MVIFPAVTGVCGRGCHQSHMRDVQVVQHVNGEAFLVNGRLHRPMRRIVLLWLTRSASQTCCPLVCHRWSVNPSGVGVRDSPPHMRSRSSLVGKDSKARKSDFGCGSDFRESGTACSGSVKRKSALRASRGQPDIRLWPPGRRPNLPARHVDHRVTVRV